MIFRSKRPRPDRRIAPYTFRATSSTATRAIYVSPTEMPHIELTFITTLGERVVIDMTAADATNFVNQCINAHNVIFPRLRNVQGPIAG